MMTFIFKNKIIDTRRKFVMKNKEKIQSKHLREYSIMQNDGIESD